MQCVQCNHGHSQKQTHTTNNSNGDNVHATKNRQPCPAIVTTPTDNNLRHTRTPMRSATAPPHDPRTHAPTSTKVGKLPVVSALSRCMVTVGGSATKRNLSANINSQQQRGASSSNEQAAKQTSMEFSIPPTINQTVVNRHTKTKLVSPAPPDKRSYIGTQIAAARRHARSSSTDRATNTLCFCQLSTVTPSVPRTTAALTERRVPAGFSPALAGRSTSAGKKSVRNNQSTTPTTSKINQSTNQPTNPRMLAFLKKSVGMK